MAKKKQAAASARQGKRSKGHIGLGIKKFGGQAVSSGNIIVRQRGGTFFPGENVLIGRDYTIFAITDGFVSYRKKLGRTYIDVLQTNPNTQPCISSK
ncbi:50S ribosomal protein L27 [candidate division WWE3 bacterium CG_4_9_14_3_um_filter_41_6]|uniref:Large ribosomal subunit protein bL27 n=1 Tax=candidate division WWE3 bacterium CG_4_10_14_0_2_um_filter_41_14 TaxID=1975072 RepID=A0A2M7TH99_UNCKA|nr:MAG: 50S ribosomal protein L27 [candidate division WWE3 bacterium CG_4_10_14_0_2_um_filter_41_14]PJA39681.1 MAG: 50S ribosomal protein L27 [candidate division WWE3 bacterium CG_4_9_14_3_um_filter_41_6]